MNQRPTTKERYAMSLGFPLLVVWGFFAFAFACPRGAEQLSLFFFFLQFFASFSRVGYLGYKARRSVIRVLLYLE